MTIKTKAGQGQALAMTELDNNFAQLHEMARGTGAPVQVGLDAVTQDWGWRDMVGVMTHDLSASLPAIATYLGGIKQRQFAVGNEVTIEFHVPHDYVPGTNLYIHAHWSHASAAVTGGGVTWQFEAISAKGHNTDAFYTPVLINVTQAANPVRYQHMIAETLASEPASVALLDTNWIDVDGLIIVTCRLTGNTLTGGALPFLHSVDLHYQSSNRSTRNKAPDFYA